MTLRVRQALYPYQNTWTPFDHAEMEGVNELRIVGEEPMYLYGRNIEAEIDKAKQLRAEHLREVLSEARPEKAFGWLLPSLQAAVLRLFRGRSQSAA